jgi:hypothetical protein
MANTEMFQKLTLQDLARWLELHPYDIVRILVAADALPDDLRFESGDVDRVRELGGIEAWWADAPAGAEDEAGLRAALVKQLNERGAFGDEGATRFDNLLRGLGPDHQVAMRRVAQQLIKEHHLVTRPTATGLQVFAPEDQRGWFAEQSAAPAAG